MKIGGYETNVKKKIISINKEIYREGAGRKPYNIMYTYEDGGRQRPMWKGFNTRIEAQAYIDNLTAI